MPLGPDKDAAVKAADRVMAKLKTRLYDAEQRLALAAAAPGGGGGQQSVQVGRAATEPPFIFPIPC